MAMGSLRHAIHTLVLGATVLALHSPVPVLAGPFDEFIEENAPNEPARPQRPQRPQAPPQRPQSPQPQRQQPQKPQQQRPQRPPARRLQPPPPPPPLSPDIFDDEEQRPSTRPQQPSRPQAPARPQAPTRPQTPQRPQAPARPQAPTRPQTPQRPQAPARPQQPPAQKQEPVRPPAQRPQPPPPPPPLGLIDDDWEIIVTPEPDSEDDPKNKHESRLEFERQNRSDLPMFVTRTSWTEQDEEQFGRFITQMGEAIAAKKCNTVKGCFQSREANMYADKDPKDVFFTSDCADFPYLLRAYFAYHNGLPFGHTALVKKNLEPVASMKDVDASDPKYEIRYSPYGNTIVRRGFSTAGKKMGAEPNLIKYLTNMFNSVHTGTFRVSPLTEHYNLSDFYPVKINRDGIKAGTVVHATGHVFVVWKVDERGRVHMIDANTQAGVSYKVLQPSTIDFTRPDQALGFFRFRPLTLVGATQASNGAYYGGKIVGVTDEQLFQEGKYSLEQWFGPDSNLSPGSRVEPDLWRQAFKGQTDFFEFVTSRLRDPNVVVAANEIINDMIDSLCEQFHQRLADVKSTLNNGIHRLPHPNELPADIFGQSDPTWGAYSTPNRDGRLRASIVDIVKEAVRQFKLAKSGSERSVRYDGSAEEYVNALKNKVASMNRTCSITYTNSAGKPVKLTFNQLLSRLNKISFDPYHCAEKRWGASGSELATCVDTDRNNEWYEAQKYMRNTVGKMSASGVYVIRSDRPITLDMLKNGSLIDQPESSPINLGVSKAPAMSLEAIFASPQFLTQLSQ